MHRHNDQADTGPHAKELKLPELKSAPATGLSLIAMVAIFVPSEAATRIQGHEAEHPTAIRYRIERVADMRQDINKEFTAAQLAVLEKLNRADIAHLRRLPQLVIPDLWFDELQYSPFPPLYPGAACLPKLLLVDLPTQAFAAYEEGHLVRWGPVSSGREAYPTPTGMFHLDWRTLGRHSTVNPQWYMDWYFNFHNARGLALHHYALPGYPASHACVRLLERDAIWMYDWGKGWTLGPRGEIVQQGTPLIINGQYAFGAPPPWRSLERLAEGINLPEPPVPSCVPTSSFGRHPGLGRGGVVLAANVMFGWGVVLMASRQRGRRQHDAPTLDGSIRCVQAA